MDVGRRWGHVHIILIIVLLYKHGLKAPLWSLWRKLEPSKRRLMSHSSRCIKPPSVSLDCGLPRCRCVLSAEILMAHRLFCLSTFWLVCAQVGKGCRFSSIILDPWTLLKYVFCYKPNFTFESRTEYLVLSTTIIILLTLHKVVISFNYL